MSTQSSGMILENKEDVYLNKQELDGDEVKPKSKKNFFITIRDCKRDQHDHGLKTPHRQHNFYRKASSKSGMGINMMVTSR